MSSPGGRSCSWGEWPPPYTAICANLLALMPSVTATPNATPCNDALKYPENRDNVLGDLEMLLFCIWPWHVRPAHYVCACWAAGVIRRTIICCSCGAAIDRQHFTKAQQGKRSAERRCKQCVAAGNTPAPAGRSQSATPSSSKRQRRADAEAAAGKVRVRDVQKHYGHLCGIPLQAYIDADVAWSRND
jgi:hypothetical protein